MSTPHSPPSERTDQEANVGEQIEAIVRDRANDTCEECTTDSDLTLYNLGSDDGFSIDDIKLLCSACYTENHSPKQFSEAAVMKFFSDISLPFLASTMVAQEFDVTPQSARRKLNSLVEAGDLERYELDGRRTLYFRPDFRAGNEFLENLRDVIDFSELDTQAVQAFAKQPFKILPRQKEQEYYVVVPRFLPFSLGHLETQDDAWQVFVVNRYVSWFSELPDEIDKKIHLRQHYDKAVIDGSLLEFSDEEEREQAWEEFDGRNGGLHKREGDAQIRVQKGKEFDVVASLIDKGNLPFAPAPIPAEEIRPEPTTVTLRDYQRDAWDSFEEYGSVGIFWPPGAGKSFIGLYAGDRIKGEKLVAVPSTILKEQWETRIEETTRNPDEWTVRTYQYLTHSDGANLEEFQGDDSPALTIYDEAHFIAADSFSKLAMIDTDYRIGLSASPYREDGREEYIFALTGMPVGVDWQKLVKHGVVDYPEAFVYLYKTQRQKRQALIDLVNERPGKGLIYCDSLDDGHELSEELGIPFVHGDTPDEDRIDIVRNNRIVLISRVGDEGMSLPDIDWTVEFDFLGSSRRQEIQRPGRLMHGNGSDDGDAEITEHSNQHILMMTDKEADKFGDRLLALEEKGIEVQFERKTS